MSKKVGIFVVVIVVAAVAATILVQNRGGFSGFFSREFVPVDDPDTAFDSEEEYLAYFERLNEAYKKDTYGGDTPEETLELFIAALESGDIELASKYFVVEKQRKMAEDLAIGLESGGVELLLEVLAKEKNGRFYIDSDDKFIFTISGSGGVVEFTVDLVKNTHTGKWKIENL